MSMLMLISIKIQRKILLVDSISLAFMSMLLFKPYYLFDVGFQLSFAVSFALILSSQTILPRFHSSFSQLMAVSAMHKSVHFLYCCTIFMEYLSSVCH